MHLRTPIVVVFGFGFDEGVETIDNLAVAYDDDAHRAHAGTFGVGGFEIYCCKVVHVSLNGIGAWWTHDKWWECVLLIILLALKCVFDLQSYKKVVSMGFTIIVLRKNIVDFIRKID